MGDTILFPGYECGFVGTPFNMDFDDQELFPPLAQLEIKPRAETPVEAEKENIPEELTSSEEKADIALSEESSLCITEDLCLDLDGKSEMKDEWVMVASTDADSMKPEAD